MGNKTITATKQLESKCNSFITSGDVTILQQMSDKELNDAALCLVAAIKHDWIDAISIFQRRYTEWDIPLKYIFTVWHNEETPNIANKLLSYCPENKRKNMITKLYLYYPNGPNEAMKQFINQNTNYLDYDMIQQDNRLHKPIITLGIADLDDDELPSFLYDVS